MFGTSAAPPPETFMQQALSLARKGRGLVEPNPMVGAVLVRKGKVVGEGYHQRCGGPHAEVHALEACGDARGTDLYVTLEPCCHFGKTPPCTRAIIQAGVKRVFIAMTDPYEEVAGRGIDTLKKAGLEVHVGLCEDDARELNEPFIKRVSLGLPWVIAKWAQTLEGAVATATGHSQWISNAASRQYVHQLRARVDAIMVGVGTVIADDPQLTARHVKRQRTARRIVVDPNLRIPLQCAMIRGLDDAPLTIVAQPQLITQRPDRLVQMKKMGVDFAALPLRSMLEKLVAKTQATNVMVEGGPTLISAMLAEGLIDQMLVFVAPKILGDTTALHAIQGFARQRMDQTTNLSLRHVRQFEDDVMLDYRVTQDELAHLETLGQLPTLHPRDPRLP